MSSAADELMRRYEEFVVTSYSKPFPLMIVKGEDVYVTDVLGKQYLDFWAGIATVNAGHNNPRVQGAVMEQMKKLVHIASNSYYTLPALELAEKLASLAPMKPSKVAFFTSGSEANDVAMKMVRRYTKRHEILALMGAYHGKTYGAESLGAPISSYPKSPVIGPYPGGVIHVPAPYCYRCSLGLEYPSCHIRCAKILEDIINFATTRDVAAYMAEVIMGAGGIIPPPQEYFQEVKKILDRYDILMILDEVQTGIGRTGRFWGSESYGVKPNLMTLAKALGNGWPISAIVASKDVGDALQPGDHFSTWSSNPVMCAAAHATIQYVEEHRLWENAEKMGSLLLTGLKELQAESEIIGDVRGRGLMLGLEIVKSKGGKEPNAECCTFIRKLSANNGLLLGVGGFWRNVIRIQPPLTITEEHVEKALDILKKTVREVKQ